MTGTEDVLPSARDAACAGAPCLRCGRGVERSVEFLLSPRLGEAYEHLKEQGASLPLVGRAVFLPTVGMVEGATKSFLVIVQTPLPSAESVANVAEVTLEKMEHIACVP